MKKIFLMILFLAISVFITSPSISSSNSKIIGNWSEENGPGSIEFYKDGTFSNKGLRIGQISVGNYTVLDSNTMKWSSVGNIDIIVPFHFKNHRLILEKNSYSEKEYVCKLTSPLSISKNKIFTNSKIVGNWSEEDGQGNIKFFKDGTFSNKVLQIGQIGVGNYTVLDSNTMKWSSTGNIDIIVHFHFKNHRLVLEKNPYFSKEYVYKRITN